jgi:hypothetical protein
MTHRPMGDTHEGFGEAEEAAEEGRAEDAEGEAKREEEQEEVERLLRIGDRGAIEGLVAFL